MVRRGTFQLCIESSFDFIQCEDLGFALGIIGENVSVTKTEDRIQKRSDDFLLELFVLDVAKAVTVYPRGYLEPGQPVLFCL